MKRSLVAACLALAAGIAGAASEQPQVGRSPWGPDDEIGRLNLMTPQSRADVLGRLDGRHVYDLAVEYFIGMPGWYGAGDPHYQFWMGPT